MFLDRLGYLEETWFTFSLSPILDEHGAVTGLFHPVTETTAHNLAQRRTRTLRDLTGRMSEARTLDYIEDNLSNLTLVERILRRFPTVELMPAMQATIGLDLARQHQPDLIVLDVHLPDMSGTEVLTRLKAETGHLRHPRHCPHGRRERGSVRAAGG